jgi:hypothetical protein
MSKSDSLPSSGHYNANYGNFQSELYEQIRREAFGEDIGQNSWLTSDEQDRFLEWLELAPGKTLLDVACGARGPSGLPVTREQSTTCQDQPHPLFPDNAAKRRSRSKT